MDHSESETCLLHNDVLDNVTQAIYDDADIISSGYESGDSLTPPTSPFTTQRVKASSSRRREVMLYTSMGSLSDSLQCILDMPELCDVTFLVGDKYVPVYGVKAILATRSRIFYQIILHHQRKVSEAVKPKSRFRRSKSRETVSSVHSPLQIPVPDYDVSVFSSLMSFLHSGRVRVELGTVTGLLCAAVEFELKDLQKACWDFISRFQGQDHREALVQSAERYIKKKGAQNLLKAIVQQTIHQTK